MIEDSIIIDVKKASVQALSQRPNHGSVPEGHPQCRAVAAGQQ
jgi:hypothetical protein